MDARGRLPRDAARHRAWHGARRAIHGELCAAGRIAAGLVGDYNNNGVVDAGDFVVWRNNLGQSVTLPNDTTPGSVAQADYNVWRTNFGKVAGSGIGGAAALVPEPVSLSMLGLVSGVLGGADSGSESACGHKMLGTADRVVGGLPHGGGRVLAPG
ncbi:MAG: hypothetical protein U0805_13545 [Pirellulales bacterium]